MPFALVRLSASLRVLAFFAPGGPVMHPQGHFARSIFELSSWVLWVCLAIFLLVTGLVFDPAANRRT